MNPYHALAVLALFSGNLSICLGDPSSPPTFPVNGARVIGELADGSPSPPETAKPGFTASNNDILATQTLAEGGRTITIQKIKPIALQEPEAVTPVLDLSNPTVQARVAAMQASHPKIQIVYFGATVYRSQNSPTRTFATYRPGGTDTAISFWSSADFSLFSGFSDFTGSDGKTRSLIMSWSTVDIDRLAESFAKRGREYSKPKMPELPAGEATFVISGNPPDAESLAAIQSLHDLYNNEHDRLKAAYESREQARLAVDAELKAHPPQPKNIVISYWLTQTPEKGGDQ